MEHLRHLQLAEDPFRCDPLEKFDVTLASQRLALARLDRGVRQGKGLLLLLGGVGAGKTRIARWLFEELEEELFEAGMLVVLRREVGSDWLLPRLARQLGVDEPSPEREALIAQIYERLAIVHEDGRRAVVIIDEAHALADPDTLAEVCSLIKLEYEDRRLLTVLLVGGTPLARAFQSDPMLAHSVDVRVELDSLPRAETDTYLQSRIAVAGGNSELLLPGALAGLHELAGGAPGRLNVLADNALYEAYLAERSQVTRNDVERASSGLAWDRLGAKPGSGGANEGAVELTELASPNAAANPSAEALNPVASHTVVMDFDASPSAAAEPLRASAQAEPTRVEFADVTEPEAPPKEENDVDDLFMELLDD